MTRDGNATNIENEHNVVDCTLLDADLVNQGRPLCYGFNNFFLTRLFVSEYEYQGIRRWPTHAMISVASFHLLIPPVNLENFHWVLVATDLKQLNFLYLDSLHGHMFSVSCPRSVAVYLHLKTSTEQNE